MKLFTFLFSLAFFFSFSSLSAQTDRLPDNPKPGKCYVKCVKPATYTNVEEKVMTKPAYKRLVSKPAEYRTETEKIMTKPATKRFKYIPATFKTETQTVIIKEASSNMKLATAKFNPSYDVVEVTPAIARWELGPKLPDCASENPDDCRVWCYKQYPAKYKTVATMVIDADAKSTKTPIAERTRAIRKQVLDEPARVEEIAIPAEYTTVSRQVLVKDASVETTDVPAEYTSVTKEVLADKGGLTVWEEIECELVSYNPLPINYELGSAKLTPGAKKIIDETLVTLLTDKPLIRIELSSHTDARGSSASNDDLSRRRAQSVVEYLQTKGINASRLVAKGFGETRLLNRCANGVTCTEREHLANRRTEFRVIDGQ